MVPSDHRCLSVAWPRGLPRLLFHNVDAQSPYVCFSDVARDIPGWSQLLSCLERGARSLERGARSLERGVHRGTGHPWTVMFQGSCGLRRLGGVCTAETAGSSAGSGKCTVLPQALVDSAVPAVEIRRRPPAPARAVASAPCSVLPQAPVDSAVPAVRVRRKPPRSALLNSQQRPDSSGLYTVLRRRLRPRREAAHSARRAAAEGSGTSVTPPTKSLL